MQAGCESLERKKKKTKKLTSPKKKQQQLKNRNLFWQSCQSWQSWLGNLCNVWAIYAATSKMMYALREGLLTDGVHRVEGTPESLRYRVSHSCFGVTWFMAHGPRLQYELRGGSESVHRLRTFTRFSLLSTLQRETKARAHLRPITAGGARHSIANVPHGLRRTLSLI